MPSSALKKMDMLVTTIGVLAGINQQGVQKYRRIPPNGMNSVIIFFNDTATTEIYTLSLHDALPISTRRISRHGFPSPRRARIMRRRWGPRRRTRSEEHTSELQSQSNLVCRLLL